MILLFGSDIYMYVDALYFNIIFLAKIDRKWSNFVKQALLLLKSKTETSYILILIFIMLYCSSSKSAMSMLRARDNRTRTWQIRRDNANDTLRTDTCTLNVFRIRETDRWPDSFLPYTLFSHLSRCTYTWNVARFCCHWGAIWQFFLLMDSSTTSACISRRKITKDTLQSRRSILWHMKNIYQTSNFQLLFS